MTNSNDFMIYRDGQPDPKYLAKLARKQARRDAQYQALRKQYKKALALHVTKRAGLLTLVAVGLVTFPIWGMLWGTYNVLTSPVTQTESSQKAGQVRDTQTGRFL